MGGAAAPDAAMPLVLVGQVGRRRDVVAANAVAVQAGLRVGMPATKAQALVKELVIQHADPAADGEALERLANAGIPLGNQSVLLAGVNDNIDVMRNLVHKLLMCRVRPYYIYQCDLINGSSHLRTSVAKGIEIIEGLRGHTTGYAIPQFVIDAPGGGGKVPINPGYILYHDNEKIVIRNYEGNIFEYPETGNENVQFAPQREYHDEYLYS